MKSTPANPHNGEMVGDRADQGDLLKSETLPPLVLASASPRRAELLARLGIPFVIRPSGADEDDLAHLEAAQQAQALAQRKVAQVWQPGEWALGADTVVSLNGQVLGKPSSADQQRQFLRMLSGKTHTVYTACALQQPEGGLVSFIEAAQVHFRPLADWEIEWYTQLGEGMDKAGGYGVQERGMVLVRGIEGDFFTVMGLPVAALWQVLQHSGYLRGGL